MYSGLWAKQPNSGRPWDVKRGKWAREKICAKIFMWNAKKKTNRITNHRNGCKVGCPCKYIYTNKKHKKKLLLLLWASIWVCYVYLQFFLCAYCSYMCSCSSMSKFQIHDFFFILVLFPIWSATFSHTQNIQVYVCLCLYAGIYVIFINIWHNKYRCVCAHKILE